jgi:hypothetical protein
MISKKIFFYWSGNMSWMRYMTLYSFRKMNPDWKVILYLSNNENKSGWISPEKQDYIEYHGKNYLSEVAKLNIEIKDVDLSEFPQLEKLNPVHQSDMFRYYMLYKEGGIYCDMDVLFFRPIDDFYEKVKTHDTIIHHKKFLTIGFLGSSVNNQYYKDVFDFGLKNNISNDYQSYGVDLIYKFFGLLRGDKKIIEEIEKKYNFETFYNITNSLIYEYDWTKISYNFNNAVGVAGFSNNSIGYHWFGGSSISQKINKILNEDNYKEYKNTFAEILKNINII